MNYKKIAPLAEYIDRIGAEELNFRTFMRKEYKKNNYYFEKCLIKVNANGTIYCSNKEYAPTKDEAAAILGAMMSVNFPKSVMANDALLDELLKKINKEHYQFWDRGTGKLVMVQERKMIEGRKAWVPWTYWSDGEWRSMEPDEGKLPFWTPKKAKKVPKVRIMVHEGAKTAAHFEEMEPEELKKHPWGDVLVEYEHWGMIGGALAPHRSDYDALRMAKPSEVIYICDNDYPGKAVLKEFSRNYGGAVKGVMFDDRWPEGWDMADPMPKELYTKEGRWIGPSLVSLTQLATWATETIPNPTGKGRPNVVLRREFSEEWQHCVIPEVYVHRDWPSNIFTAAEFNNRVRPFTDVEETSRLVKADAASKTATLRYSPAVPSGIFNDEAGQRFINTHAPSNIKPEKGDFGPWTEFMDHLIISDEDREQTLRWCATLLARPEIKMLYGLLLISETQGVGKGTLGERILAPLVGENNVSYPSENEIVESSFNYWAAHKRLAVVHEIYAGHSSQAYNKLKSMITDRFITVSKKYQANYEIENWVHIFACSNSNRAIKLSSDDRRWFVPKVTEKKKPPKYWTAFNRWLTEEGGLGKILYWAIEYVKKHDPVLRGDAAPASLAKNSVIEEGYSPGQLLVAQFLDHVKEDMNGEPVFMLDVDLVDMIRNIHHDGRRSDKLEKPITIRKLAKARGWEIGEHNAAIAAWGTRGVWARVISSDPEIARRLPSELAKERQPLNVMETASKGSFIKI